MVLEQSRYEQIRVHKKHKRDQYFGIDLVCALYPMRELFHLHFYLLWNCGCVLWQCHSQQSVFEIGEYLVAVYKSREREGAEKFTVMTFDAVEILTLEFFVKFALSPYRLH